MMTVGRERKRTVKFKAGMKLLLLAIGFLLTASACSSNTLSTVSSVEPSQPEENLLEEQADQAEMQEYEHVLVGIHVNEDGYYSLMSDIEVGFGENGVEDILIEDPVLLGFSVSSAYQGGVWVLNMEQGEEIISNLEEIQATLSQNGNTELAEKIRAVMEQFEKAGPITGAST